MTNIFTKGFAEKNGFQGFAVHYVALLTKKKEYKECCRGYSLKVKKSSIEIYFGGMKVRDCKNNSIAYSEMERLPLSYLSRQSYEYYIKLIEL